MTGRERLLATMRREPTDRAPLNCYELSRFGSRGWPWGEPSYERLMRAIVGRTEALDMLGMGGAVTSPSVPRESCTWTAGEFTLTRTTLHTPRGELYSTTQSTPAVKTVWTTEHLLKSREDIDRYLSLPLEPVSGDPQSFRELEAAVGDRGLVLCDMSDPAGHVASLFEFGEFMVWALTETALIRELCDQYHAANMQALRGALEAGYGPIYRICGPEYCTPPYLPPRLFGELVVPYLTEIIDLLHEYDCWARVHCHGRVGQVLEMIVAAGADALDPVEPPPDGDITLGEVKARWGDRLVLFGNMELKYLETETPAQIEARVQQMMAEAKAGGGYVLMPTAAPINVPLAPRTEANYLAFIEAGHRYGRYD